MNADADIQVHFRSDPQFLCGVRELVAQVAERLGFPSDACAQLKLAVDEALANVIRHGYDRRPDGPIWLRIHAEHAPPGPHAANGSAQACCPAIQALRIIIEDEGRQTDPADIKGRDLSDIRPGGLGVHIIRQVMDDVQYERRQSVGMRLTMRKRMPMPTAQPGVHAPDPSSTVGARQPRPGHRP